MTKIVIFCKHLMESEIITDFEVKHIDLFHNEDTARTELQKLTIVGNLFDAIDSMQSGNKIFVLIPQLDCIGIVEKRYCLVP
jgi:hypothetical protein